jgi:serine/threonine protein phosphatase 1
MIAVIGDIHGCYHTLTRLYEEIKTRYPDIPVYSVGDLVDRGNFSYEVMEFIKHNKIKFTAGNHDLMFYYYVTQPTHPIGKPWIYNGSESTMESYSNYMPAMREHLVIIKKAPLFYNLKDCFISHAGISSYYQKHFKNDVFSDNAKIKKLLEQEIISSHGVIWTRDELINLGKLQIIGHTIVKDLYHNKKSNALYTDTSAFAGNKLTAVIIEENKLVDSLSVNTVPVDIA